MELYLAAYYVVMFLWLSYFPIAALYLTHWLTNRKKYLRRDLKCPPEDPHIIFQITTRSARRSGVVKRGIDAIQASANRISSLEYSICVITEDERDVSFLTGTDCEVLVVPRNYKTENAAIRKARALQYAVDYRREHQQNSSYYWIYHLDEESVVIDQTVLSLLAFISEGRGLLAEGPIAYPLKFEKANRITALAESFRPFHCHDCVSQMTNPPPLHMHGSNLLVRADVEDRVGWDHGKTIAEDQLFGISVYQHYGQVFGWHGGILLEQPPLSLRDHFRQRRRWVIGILQNFKYLSTRLKISILFRASTYWLGFLSAVASLAMYTYYLLPYLGEYLASLFGISYERPRTPSMPIMTLESVSQSLGKGLTLDLTWQGVTSVLLGAILLASFAILLLSYQIGLGLNLRYTRFERWQRISLHLQQFLLTPVVGLVETAPAFYAIIEFFLFRYSRMDFQVITK